MRRSQAGIVSAALTTVALLAGCSHTQMTLQSRPTDTDSGQALAEAVAQKAQCGGVEPYRDSPDHWDFTCDAGPDRMFLIRTVSGPEAKKAALRELATSLSPVKEGDYLLVQEATTPGRTNTVVDLDKFPGTLVGPSS